MRSEIPDPPPLLLDHVQPIVLVGGKSRRFGRDKLREPWGERQLALVQAPVEALRRVFGPRVKLVGACDPAIRPFADGVIHDEHPGTGPIGGIVSALHAWGGPVFVLAGDMPSFAYEDVRRILVEASRCEGVIGVLASSDRLHPCAGLYFQNALPIFRSALAVHDSRLGDTLARGAMIRLPITPSSLVNVNSPEDLTP